MPTIRDIADYLDGFAPARLAAEWDNVGLLLGDGARSVLRVMTCLTVTQITVAEAVSKNADLIVSHHPFPFRAANRWTTDTNEGRFLLALVEAKIAVISPHTAFDSTSLGINQRLAERLNLQNIAPLIPDSENPLVGTGRIGSVTKNITLAQLAERACQSLAINQGVQIVGDKNQAVSNVAICCGAADELLNAASDADCDCFISGEARFHTALAAQAAGMTMILLGHFASERFAVEELAVRLAEAYVTCQVWASGDERDPIEWIAK